MLMEGGGGVKLKIYEIKKAQINPVGWQHTRVANNKTNKAQASHHSNKQNQLIEKFMK